MGSKQGDIAGGGESVRLTPRKQAASNPSTRLGLSTEGGGSEALYAGVANRADNRADKEEGGQEEDGAQATRAHLQRRLPLQQLLEVRRRCFRRCCAAPLGSVSICGSFLSKKGPTTKKGPCHSVESLENQFPDLL